MQLLSIDYYCKGFLIIELLIALGIFTTFTLLLCEYQLQVQLYKKAAAQLYRAVNLCEDTTEELWSRVTPCQNNFKIVDEFTVTTTCTLARTAHFYDIEIKVDWISALKKQKQTIVFDVICAI